MAALTVSIPSPVYGDTTRLHLSDNVKQIINALEAWSGIYALAMVRVNPQHQDAEPKSQTKTICRMSGIPGATGVSGAPGPLSHDQSIKLPLCDSSQQALQLTLHVPKPHHHLVLAMVDVLLIWHNIKVQVIGPKPKIWSLVPTAAGESLFNFVRDNIKPDLDRTAFLTSTLIGESNTRFGCATIDTKLVCAVEGNVADALMQEERETDQGTIITLTIPDATLPQCLSTLVAIAKVLS